MPHEMTFRGLIVRETAIGEQDKLISVISEGDGKLLLTCKGVRSIKSQRLAATQLFCYDEFTVTEKNGRLYLKEAVLIENFYALREDIERLALAQYVCDAVCEVSMEGETDNGTVLSLTLNTLYAVAGRIKPLPLIKGAFEMRLSAEIGFMPMLDTCSICSSEKEHNYLDINGGVLICSDCFLDMPGDKHTDTAPLPHALLLALRYVVSAPVKRLFSFTVAEELYADLSLVCEKYFLARVEHGFETLSFYHSLGF